MGTPPAGFGCQLSVTLEPETVDRTLRGASGGLWWAPAVTVALAVAVAPLAFRATSVNVVVALTGPSWSR